MSELGERTPFDEVGSEYLACLNTFDITRSHFYDWLSELAIEMPRKTTLKIECEELMDDMATAFVETAVECRRSENDNDVVKKEIALLWREDDCERVELFADVTNQNVFASISPEDMDGVVDSVFTESNNEEELAENIREMYRCYLSSDVATYLGFVETAHMERQAYQVVEAVEEDTVLFELDLLDAARRMMKLGMFIIGTSLGIQLINKYGKRRHGN